MRNPVTPPVTAQGLTPIDIRALSGGCYGNLNLYVDSHAHNITIYVDGNNYVSLSLTDAFGQIVTPTTMTNHSVAASAFFSGIQPGVYTAHIRSKSSSCLYFAYTSKSDISVAAGFVTDLHSDFPRAKIVEHQPSYFVAHANGLPCPGKIQLLEIFENNLLISSQSPMVRYACAYENVFGLINCDYASSYYYKMFGIDENGFAFQRTDTIQCTQTAPTTTPMPTTTTVAPSTTPYLICQNGGTNVNGVCLCPAYFAGRDCSLWLCANGGTPQVRPGCLCPKPFSGPHCTAVKCDFPSDINETTHSITLGVVFLSRDTMYQDQTALAATLRTYLSQVQQQYAGWITQFVVTFFSDVDGSTVTRKFNNAHDFITAFAAQQLGASTSCQQPTMTALLNQLMAASFPVGSPILVFTDAAPSDPVAVQLVFQSNFYGAQISFIVTDASHLSPCKDAITDSNMKYYRQVAHATQGFVVSVGKTDVGNWVTEYMPGMYHGEAVMAGDLAMCNAQQPPYSSFFVDSYTQQVFVQLASATSRTAQAFGAFNLTVTDPLGAVTNMYAVSGKGNFVWYQLSTPTPGLYRFQMSLTQAGGDGLCSFRVKANTLLRSYLRYTPDPNTDSVNFQPYQGNPVYPVTSFTLGSPVASTGALSISTAPGKFLYFGSPTLRSSPSCTFARFYQKFTCTGHNEVFSAQVIGTDANGHTFQRVSAGYCAADPVTPPPPGGCQNGGVPNRNGTCICQAFWTGPKCSQIVCGNGGTPLDGSFQKPACQCPHGFDGPNCLTVTCANRNADVPNSPDGRSLAFVLDLGGNNTQAIQELQSNVDHLLGNVRAQSEFWITSYVLTTVSDHGVFTNAYASPGSFESAVNRLTPVPGSKCQQPLAKALLSALNASLPRSQTFLLTAGTAADYAMESNVYDAIAQKQATVNTIITRVPFCGSPTLNGAPDARFLQDVARFANGLLLVLEPSKIFELLLYIPTLYSSSLAGLGGNLLCTGGGTTAYFPLDSAATQFTVAVSGYNNSITLTDPYGRVQQPSYLVSGSAYSQIVTFYAKHGTGPIATNFTKGLWSVNVRTSPLQFQASGCSIQVRVQSSLNLFYGYTTTSASGLDFPHPQPFSAGKINTMVAHMTMPKGGSLNYANFYSLSTNKMAASFRMSRRDHCGYEFFSTAFTCDTFAYQFAALGVDQNGLPFSRIATIKCITPPLNCVNGGVKSADGKTCFCPRLWSGRDCSVPRCFNGGSPNGNACHCLQGFGGVNCQSVICTTPSPTPPPNTYGGRTFGLVFDANSGMFGALASMKSGLPGFLQNLTTQNPNWFSSFLIVPFTRQVAKPINQPHYFGNSVGPFISYVNSLNTPFIQEDCPNPVLFGVAKALQYAAPGSDLMVMSISSALYPEELATVLPLAIRKRVRINLMLYNAVPCGNLNSFGTIALLHAASLTGGAVMEVSQKNAMAAMPYWSYGTISASQLDNRAWANCSAGQQGGFQVDTQVFGLTFLLTGRNINAVLRDPNGRQISLSDPSQVKIVYRGLGGQSMVHVDVPAAGAWVLYAMAEGPCSVDLRASTALTLNAGFTSTESGDSPTITANFSIPNYIVVSPSVPVMSVDYVVESGDARGAEFAPRMLPRKGCAYGFVSAQPITCTQESLMLKFVGKDAMGQAFSRYQRALCPGAPVALGMPDLSKMDWPQDMRLH